MPEHPPGTLDAAVSSARCFVFGLKLGLELKNHPGAKIALSKAKQSCGGVRGRGFGAKPSETARGIGVGFSLVLCPTLTSETTRPYWHTAYEK